MERMTGNEFHVLVLCPVDFGSPALAAAAARAGGVGVLDAESGPGASFDRIRESLALLLDATGPDQPIGLRLSSKRWAEADELLALIGERPHWLVVAGPPSDPIEIAPAARRRVLLELTSLDDPSRLDAWADRLHGLVARGSESGGPVGSETAFILSQRLLATGRLPVYVQGGVGPHIAAACRAAGAAGVVLDDQLWLMPESPLPPDWRRHLENLSGREALAVGSDLVPLGGRAVRVLVKPQFKAAAELQDLAAGLAAEAEEPGRVASRWEEGVSSLVGWGPPEEKAWPVGQAVGLAAAFRDRYVTTGRFVQAVLEQSRTGPALAAELDPLGPDSPLAQAHGTRYPLVQGPMARVSDTPEFLRQVAEARGLPMVALSTLEGPEARELLDRSAEALGDRPWGVGLLGFGDLETKEAQTAEVIRAKPTCVLIAGGRPDQAAVFESAGVPAYLHAPTPELVKIFLEQGARRFILEGRECGGHVGPLSSFVLWESAIAALLDHSPQGRESGVHVLFAGGVHDARSAAMVAAAAAPLAARGIKVGVLMGTAYLFTKEAVASLAITPIFQDQALTCRFTVTLDIAPGHANRVAPSSFADEFLTVRRRLVRQGAPPKDVAARLADLCRGRLRISAKGRARDEDGRLRDLDPAEQLSRGMYMMGQLAGLRGEVTTMSELHRQVSQGWRELLVRTAGRFGDATSPAASPQPSDVAIVGLAALLPKARDPETFWRNLVNKVEVVTEVPKERWDWRLFYDPDRKSPDKAYSKWGGFFDGIVFDPLRYGIPPNSLNSIGVSQILALEVVRWALKDAGYEQGGFDRENTAVIFGSADTGGSLGNSYVFRSLLPMFVEPPLENVLARLPEWTEESFPGTLTNIVSGRVANRFDLGGPNLTVDAACASALYALDAAVKELESGRSNLVVVGGLDVGQTPYSYQAFSRTQALSPTGRARVFDKAADGIVISEGIVVLILKRLADAERDGDKIYAVIKGLGASSDGKALGLTAPRPDGQRRALARAYARAGFGPATIGLYEAHGTGTPVGDEAEIETIVRALTEDDAAPKTVAVGSVKSLLGHTKTAAGLVGVLKAALALHHQVLPPHAGAEDPLDEITDPESPVALFKEAKPWLADPAHPRRAGVSAFGFGGTNTHVVLEEYLDPVRRSAPGGPVWPCELVALRAADSAALSKRIGDLLEALEAGAEPRLRDLAYSLAVEIRSEAGAAGRVLCVVCENLLQLKAALTAAQAHLEDPAGRPLPPHIILGETGRDPGRLAFLFPGQGAQYPDMAREASLHFTELRACLEAANGFLAERFPQPLSAYIYPPGPFSAEEEERLRDRLRDSHVAQPAIGVISAGLLALAERLGLKPDMLAGHSYGEYTALYAAGVLSWQDFLAVSEARGRLMAEACDVHGAMASVQAERREVERLLAETEGVVVANHNAPNQTVISGEQRQVRRVIEQLSERGVKTMLLPVAGAFHSALMEPPMQPLSEVIAALKLNRPGLPVYSNVTGRLYPSDPDGIEELLKKHLLSTVEFVAQIERAYADGARVFVELGPRAILTGLVGRILEGRDHLAVAAEGQGGGLRGLLISLGRLLAGGVDVDLEALFAGREVARLDLARLAETTRPPEPPATAWLVNGWLSRPLDRSRESWGKAPLLTAETAVARPGRLGFQPGEPDGDGDAVRIYQSYQETMRRFLALQERVVNQLLEGQPLEAIDASAVVEELAGPTPEPPPVQPSRPSEPALAPSEPAETPPEPEEPRRTAEEPTGPEALVARLSRMISERTGYPEDMLGPDLDLEAELGIDSIKRVEILEALLAELNRETSARLRDRMEVLTRAKSLNALAEAIAPELAAEPEPDRVPPPPAKEAVAPAREEAAPAERPATEPAIEPPPEPPAEFRPALGEEEEGEVCPRYVMRTRPQPFPRIELTRPRGLFIITEDAWLKASDLAADSLAKLGARTAVLKAETLTQPAELERAVAELRQAHGPVRGVVHLAPLAVKPMPDSLVQWKETTRLEIRSFYHLLKLCADDLQRPDEPCLGRVLAATMLGGCFGRDGHLGPGLPSGGGCLGLLKTLDLEWPRVLAKAVDFDSECSPQAAAAIVVDELLLPGGELEVGYPGGKRKVFTATPSPLSAEAEAGLEPEGDWVVLVTGGARGITAQAAQALVRPGMRFILVGRTPEPGPEPAETAALTEAAQLRSHFIDRARRKKEKATPAAIEARIREVLNARAIRANLEALRRAGGLVEYRAVDVRDEAGFGGLIDEIYARYGRLDAVVHGAGIIADKLIVDKDLRDFDRVFDTKVDAAFILSRHIRPESLKLMVFFSSTAGRFGNRGQSDYGAANEILNRFAWWMAQRWPRSRVVSINWGPWRAGMASPEVNRRFVSRGIIPIEPEAGRRFLAAEVRYGPLGQAEVIAGQGPWDKGLGVEFDSDPSLIFFGAQAGGRDAWLF